MPIESGDNIDRAVAAILAGEIVGLPTETVYGLAADARNRDAVLSVYAAKGRPLGHPLIVHIADDAALDAWARELPEWAHALADTFWPGPLTLIARKAAEVDDVVTGGHDTVAVRVPAHPIARAVIERLGPRAGIAAPSANRFGRVSPVTAEHVLSEFADRDLLVIDGGRCEIGIESTIVDCTGRTPRILRPGRITTADIADCTHLPVEESWRDGNTSTVAAPGTLAAHYAPQAEVVLVDEYAMSNVIEHALAASQRGPVHVWAPQASPLSAAALDHGWGCTGMPSDEARCEHMLYDVLRTADDNGAATLFIEVPDRLAPGRAALLDRLTRAAVGIAGRSGSHGGRERASRRAATGD